MTTVRGITSKVNFIWSSDGTVLKEEEMNVQDFIIQNLNIYSSTYTISQLSTNNDGMTYQCEVVIDASPLITEYSNVTLDVTGKEYMLYSMVKVIYINSLLLQFLLLQSV